MSLWGSSLRSAYAVGLGKELVEGGGEEPRLGARGWLGGREEVVGCAPLLGPAALLAPVTAVIAPAAAAPVAIVAAAVIAPLAAPSSAAAARPSREALGVRDTLAATRVEQPARSEPKKARQAPLLM